MSHVLARTKFAFNDEGHLIALDYDPASDLMRISGRLVATKDQLERQDLLLWVVNSAYEMGLSDAQAGFREGLGRLLDRNL